MLDLWSRFETVQVMFTFGMFAAIVFAVVFAALMKRERQNRKLEAQKHMEWKEQFAITQEEARRSHERALQLDDRKKAIPHIDRNA